ncbi:porin [Adhaeribacter terrigena]|uniref:porin n=1 Tax=Adhaeribacter terrigena TaxID=2793070 RepID=UPI001F1E319E|nr:porin [Adhaeribacter terrigena]
MLLSFFISLGASGQHHNVAEIPTDSIQVRDIKDVFTHGETEGHIRNYFMATYNQGELSDHYANAIGARLGFHSAPYKGFRFGLAGLFTYNAFSSDLAEPDYKSGKLPRYELELFDIEEAENKADLDRLDELYLEYHTKHIKATIGRFSFTSPLINPQDGRMKPYSVQGISLEIPVKQNGRFSLAWLDHFSPRSTVSWYQAGESIGIYPVGVDENGRQTGYKSQVQTTGIAVAGFQWQKTGLLKSETWNYWIENVSNTTYTKLILEVKPKFRLGAEGLFQTQVGNGGNLEPALAYFPDQQQWLAGGKIAFEPSNWHFSANYLHLGAEGRFLFPREFGREQFFVTTPRGRLEGLGNSDALAVKARKDIIPKLSAEAAITKTWLPAYHDFQFNKYGATSYWNGLIDLNYKPEFEPLNGLSFRLLYIARLSPDTKLPLEKRFYNTNFHHFNFVTQLTF